MGSGAGGSGRGGGGSRVISTGDPQVDRAIARIASLNNERRERFFVSAARSASRGVTSTFGNLRETGYTSADIRALNRTGLVRITENFRGGTRIEYGDAFRSLARSSAARGALVTALRNR